MKISEVFESIQGEGINAGMSAIFIRTALCNLSCSWCDTKYTWDWENYDYNNEVTEMSVDFIKEKIKQYGANNIVITGGEPLIQQDELYHLLSTLDKKYFIEVETNGTILPSKQMTYIVDQWNVSPKTSNSNNIMKRCEIEECYRFFQELDNAVFKFVVENNEDVLEILKIIDRYDIPKSRVILMPQASDRETLIAKESLIRDLANDNGLDYSSRLHIMKWGNMRRK